MRIHRIKISNILGVEALEYEAGQFNLIEGANAAGKTSVLEALKALVVEGGHDATLLRHGAKQGEVVVVFEQEQEHAELHGRLTVTDESTRRQLTSPEHGEVSKVRQVLARLTDAAAANPIAFLTAKPKERIELLLDTIPLRLTHEQIQEAVGVSYETTAGLDLDNTHALQIIEELRKRIYDDRTGVTRAAKEKRTTIAEVEPGLGTCSEDPVAAMKDMDVHLDKVEAWRESEITKSDTIRARLVQEAQFAYESAVAAAQTTRLNAVTAATVAYEKDVAHIQARVIPEREKMLRRRTELEQELRMVGARAMVTAFKTQATELEGKAKLLTGALEKIEGLKGTLLKTLPIKGLEVENGEIYYKGVPFPRLNTAQQIKISLALVRLRAPRAKGIQPVFIDGLEKLDPDNRAAFEAAARECSGIQWFVANVTAGPLSITDGGQERRKA